jgi:hypothetical protein
MLQGIGQPGGLVEVVQNGIPVLPVSISTMLGAAPPVPT